MSDLLTNINQLIAENHGSYNLARIITKEWGGFTKNRRIRYDYQVGAHVLRKHWNKLSLAEMAKLTGVSAADLSKQGRSMGLPYKPHVFRKTPNQREYQYFDIINMETGIFYGNMKECAEVMGIPKRRMQSYLRGDRKNKTAFVILGHAIR